jgi:hypothetical protein
MSADLHDPPGNRLQLIEWRPTRQNTLIGFVTVRIEPLGLVIRDVTVHRNGDSAWIGLPGKLQVDKDGRVLTDDQGKRKYTPVVEIPDREVRERLAAAVIALVKARDPQGLA